MELPETGEHGIEQELQQTPSTRPVIPQNGNVLGADVDVKQTI